MRSAIPSPRSFKGRTAVVAVVALLAALIVTASPAAAESRCAEVTDPGPDQGNWVVFLDADSTSDVDVLSMPGGVLTLNGDACGTPVDAVTIIDIGESEKLDRLLIDLSAGPFRVGTDPLFVNLFLEGDGAGGNDQVEIMGTTNADTAALTPTFTSVNQDTSFPGADDGLLLAMGGFSGATVDLEYSLNRGPDLFSMLDTDGAFFTGALVVNGNGGRDELNGGPGVQTFNGGKGGDIVNAGGGADIINGNGGPDELNGDGGPDIITAGKGTDTVAGGPGRDTIDADGGKVDEVRGGGGRDTCTCGSEDSVSSIERLR